MKKLLSKAWHWTLKQLKPFWTITVFFAKLSAFALFCVGVYIVSVIAYLPAMVWAAKKQYKHQDDLVLNDKNEIIEGSVQQGQHPLNVRSRPQPTWMHPG